MAAPRTGKNNMPDSPLSETSADSQNKKDGKKSAKKQFGSAVRLFASILVCVTVLSAIVIAIPYLRYEKALRLLEEENYSEAITAFKAVGGFIDCSELIEQCNDGIYKAKFDSAVSLYQNGHYSEAIYYFSEIKDYKNSIHQIERCYIGRYGSQMYELLSTVKTGETFTFGHYEQDNNLSNGKEAIEWRVLAREKDKILVISEYILDLLEPDTTGTEDFNTRVDNWLNTTFAEAAFTDEEYAFIKQATSFYHHYDLGETIEISDEPDMFFLLNTSELNNYFKTKEERLGVPTEYALARGVVPGYVLTEEGYGTGWRKLHLDESESSGSTASESLTDGGGLRPAFWIDFITVTE